MDAYINDIDTHINSHKTVSFFFRKDADPWSGKVKPKYKTRNGYTVYDGRIQQGKNLGSGEFGVTYECYLYPQNLKKNTKPLKSRVALKLCNTYAMGDRRSFMEEKKANEYVSSYLPNAYEYDHQSSDHVAKFIGFYKEKDGANNDLNLIFEFIDGATLEDIFGEEKEVLHSVTNSKIIHAKLKSGAILSSKQKILMLSQLAGALGNICKHHCLHTDLSPSNIMWNPEQGIKIIDFGFVRKFSEIEYKDQTKCCSYQLVENMLDILFGSTQAFDKLDIFIISALVKDAERDYATLTDDQEVLKEIACIQKYPNLGEYLNAQLPEELRLTKDELDVIWLILVNVFREDNDQILDISSIGYILELLVAGTSDLLEIIKCTKEDLNKEESKKIVTTAKKCYPKLFEAL